MDIAELQGAIVAVDDAHMESAALPPPVQSSLGGAYIPPSRVLVVHRFRVLGGLGAPAPAPARRALVS